ncbi:MAG: UPF0280 family protein [Clostridiales bacterium]|nr:UPF0280 family protein [Clostridiales bacterium]
MVKEPVSVVQERFYRQIYDSKDLVHFNLRVGETDLNIGAERILDKETLKLAKECRQVIESYIKDFPDFLTSLRPVSWGSNAPDIIKAMCLAADKAGVGPMAAVAGVIAQYVGEGLEKFSREIIVENGGDIYINGSTERMIGIYAGDSSITGKVGIRIRPEDLPLGVCTSAGKVGHSLSFGQADAAVAISPDTVLADAVATAIGNRVKTPNDIQKALDFAKTIPEITGALIVIDNELGAWGNIELIRL